MTGTAPDSGSSKSISWLRGTVPARPCGGRSFDSNSSNAGTGMADLSARSGADAPRANPRRIWHNVDGFGNLIPEDPAVEDTLSAPAAEATTETG